MGAGAAAGWGNSRSCARIGRAARPILPKIELPRPGGVALKRCPAHIMKIRHLAGARILPSHGRRRTVAQEWRISAVFGRWIA
jgi:hypothetical protein